MISLVKYEGIKEKDDEVEEIECGETEETECVGSNKGECLMIRKGVNRKILHALRNSKSGDFSYKMHDGGSCANVASQVLVEKLKLSTSPHPHPYVIRWLNQIKGLQVARRVFLSFSIGKSYKEKIWCNVVPMDACHILLGRPWLFDRRVIYDGYANTYSFNGRKITLIPNSKPKSKKPHSSLTIINANMSCVPKRLFVGSSPSPGDAKPHKSESLTNNIVLIESSLRTNSAKKGGNVGTPPSFNKKSFNPPF